MKTARVLSLVIFLAASLSSCTAMRGGWNNARSMPPAAAPTAAPSGVPSYAPAKLMIFGGSGHKTYLGSLNCSQYDEDSVLNSFGAHGSAYSDESILNHFSEFGSPYSSTSACSEYASDPPVVVDPNGKFYGRLTVNQYASERLQVQQVNAWLAAACH